jgi:hypothetical protein
MGSYTSETPKDTALAADFTSSPGEGEEKKLQLMNTSALSHFHYRLKVSGRITKVPNNTEEVSPGVLEGFIQERSPDNIKYTGEIVSFERKSGPGMENIEIWPETARSAISGILAGTGQEPSESDDRSEGRNGKKNSTGTGSSNGDSSQSLPTRVSAGIQNPVAWARDNPVKASLIGVALFGGGYTLMVD